MVKVYADKSHESESRSPKSDETVAYVANTRLATAFELTTPSSRTEIVAHGLRSFSLRVSSGLSSGCLASGDEMSSVISAHCGESVSVPAEILQLSCTILTVCFL